VRTGWPLALFLLAGCTGDDIDDTSGDTDDTDTGVIVDTGDTGPVGPLPCSLHMNLELVPLDIWGRDLDGGQVRLDREPRLLDDSNAGPGVVLVPLGTTAVELQVVVEGPGYHPTGLTITYDGGAGWNAFELSEPSNDGRAVASFDDRLLEDVSCPVFSVYLGADHPWFAASGRAPNPNGFTFFMDGEEMWAAAKPDLEQATERVTWGTWFWESDFELVRPPGHASLSESQRAANTAMGVLEALPGVERRIIVNRFWSDNLDFLIYINSDTALRDHAETANDDFEVVLQGNPTEVPLTGQFLEEANPWSFGERVLSNARYADRSLVIDDRRAWRDLIIDAATWHQKGFAIDGRVAFVTGMNTKGVDWDSNKHRVFDERRMGFDASEDERMEVADREELPEYGPRKDYGVRLEGPGARDVDHVLWGRWEWAMAQGHLYADQATPYILGPPAPAPAGAVLSQVVASQPQPFGERSILETQAKAIQLATDYIFIEDQYFRAPLLADLIVARMLEEPDLLLIVVSKPVSDLDPGAKFTYLADATFRSLFPDRYLLLQLKTVDVVIDPGFFWDDVDLYALDVDTHSKLRLVDDTYLSVGSCNFHNRAYLFEGELNVSVLDPPTVVSARRRVFSNLVGSRWAPLLTDDAADNFEILAWAAADNASLLTWWEENASDLDAEEAEAAWSEYRPSGFVYPLEISSEYLFDVGPDIF
jgi:phosphatidylserine/phosphatidylglycerophosphate/cardiolipin synthase-like enzyme